VERKMALNIIEKVTDMMGVEPIVGQWIKITQDNIDKFTESGGEEDWLHNDPELCAKESPFEGKTIVQGNLLLSLHTSLAESVSVNTKGFKYGLNYGYDRVRIIQPVTVNSNVRSKITVKEIIAKSNNTCLAKCDVITEVQGIEKPALIAEWLFFVQFDLEQS
jgi:acyl dehydratase